MPLPKRLFHPPFLQRGRCCGPVLFGSCSLGRQRGGLIRPPARGKPKPLRGMRRRGWCGGGAERAKQPCELEVKQLWEVREQALLVSEPLAGAAFDKLRVADGRAQSNTYRRCSFELFLCRGTASTAMVRASKRKEAAKRKKN